MFCNRKLWLCVASAWFVREHDLVGSKYRIVFSFWWDVLCYEIEPPPSNLTCYHLVYQDYHRKTDWTNTSTIFHTSYCLGLEINFYDLTWTRFFFSLTIILHCIPTTTIKSHRDIFAGDEFWWLTRAKVRHCLLCESRRCHHWAAGPGYKLVAHREIP